MLFRHNSLTLKSYSKINLSLNIVGLREDGYHFIDSVMLPTTIHDTVEVRVAPYSGTTTVVCDEVLLQRNHHNLCLNAVNAMRERYHFKENFTINIHKVIPVSSGMGGGSSNAATVLIAINKLLHLNATQEELKEIALQIGTDVPFFLNPRPARIQGIGEKIEFVPCDHNYYVLVVKPLKGLLTKEVYYEENGHKGSSIETEALLKALKDGDDKALPGLVSNGLLSAALVLYPELEDVIKEVKELGFSIVSMTGSGSAIFALSDNKKAIEQAEYTLIERGYKVEVGKAGEIIPQ